MRWKRGGSSAPTTKNEIADAFIVKLEQRLAQHDAQLKRRRDHQKELIRIDGDRGPAARNRGDLRRHRRDRARLRRTRGDRDRRRAHYLNAPISMPPATMSSAPATRLFPISSARRISKAESRTPKSDSVATSGETTVTRPR